jgi:hypothetical protein
MNFSDPPPALPLGQNFENTMPSMSNTFGMTSNSHMGGSQNVDELSDAYQQLVSQVPQIANNPALLKALQVLTMSSQQTPGFNGQQFSQQSPSYNSQQTPYGANQLPMQYQSQRFGKRPLLEYFIVNQIPIASSPEYQD